MASDIGSRLHACMSDEISKHLPTRVAWDCPDADPLKDILDAARSMGMPSWPSSGKKAGKSNGMAKYYTGFEVSKSPGLAYCSRCGTKRIALKDPWVVTKECPTCRHIDPVPSATLPVVTPPPTTPETITLAEVQRLLVGVLRQVDGNKVIIHPTEFDLTCVTLLQETNTETGTVTIWFEKQTNEICGDIRRTDDGSWQCTKPKDHIDEHGDVNNKSIVGWVNTRWTVPCSSSLRDEVAGLIPCLQADGHVNDHRGYNSKGECVDWPNVMGL